MTTIHKFEIWIPLLLVVAVVSFIMGRTISEPSGEPARANLPASMRSLEDESRNSAAWGDATSETTREAMEDEARDRDRDPERPSIQRRPIEAGQSWSSASLLLAINGVSDEIFAGNAERHSLLSSERRLIFPDGSAITVKFRPPSMLNERWEHLDDGVSPGFFEPLSQAAANGNGAAAQTLYSSLKICERVSKAVTERCQGTTAEMMGVAVELLRQTGEAGNELSSLLWAMEVAATQPVVAERVFDRLWHEGGNTAALGNLSKMHRERPPSSYSESVTAYAYSYASSILALAFVDGMPDIVGRSIREDMINRMIELEGSSAYPVIQEGTPLAYRLIAENRNCCY